ncbi:MAG: FeoB-associated Cys-rich membrane protein [Chitinophagales bacterium]
MKTFFLNSVVIFFAVFTLPVFAQDVSITAKTDKLEYLIGDYIRLQIKVTKTGDITLQLPDTDSISTFDRITVSPVDTLTSGNTIQYTQEIVYSIYDSGFYSFNPVKVIYKKQDDANYFLAQTDTILFTVNSVPVDTTKAIKPIKDIKNVQVKSYIWLYILIGLVTLGVLIFVIYKVLKNKKKTGTPPQKVPAISLYETTMKQLLQLEEKKLWQQDKTKEYYVELTDIIRTYIEQRFHLPAMENTSDEIIESLVRLGIDTHQVNNINTILQYADLAKFAKSRPFAAENNLAMQSAKDFVEATQIKVQETNQN